MCKGVKETDLEFIQDLYWKLKNIRNTGYSTSIYTLEIARKYTVYTVDKPYEIDGVLYEAGPVIRTNNHTLETFSNHFNDYFGEYDQKDEDNILCATVQLLNTEEVNEDIIRHKICVKYNNNHLLPFPVPNKCLTAQEKVLIRGFEIMEEKYNMGRNREKKLKQKVSNMKEMALRANQKICELYKTSDKKEECPVCYEQIASEKLVVTECCHYICSDCSSKWSKGCPICRHT
jgi:hypothetical protein